MPRYELGPMCKIDMISATFCIERAPVLLNSDRDFEPTERYLGLRTI